MSKNKKEKRENKANYVLKNINDESILTIDSGPPKYLVLFLSFIFTDIILGLLGKNSLVSLLALGFLIAGIQVSLKKENNYKIMYRNFIWWMVADFILQLCMISVYSRHAYKGFLGVVRIDEQSIELINRMIVIHWILTVIIIIIVIYNIKTGRKREVNEYLETQNYKLIEE